MPAGRKMSVGDLADRVGIAPAALAVLESGRARAVRFTALAALCEVLDCPPGDLFATGGRRHRRPVNHARRRRRTLLGGPQPASGRTTRRSRPPAHRPGRTAREPRWPPRPSNRDVRGARGPGRPRADDAGGRSPLGPCGPPTTAVRDVRAVQASPVPCSRTTGHTGHDLHPREWGTPAGHRTAARPSPRHRHRRPRPPRRGIALRSHRPRGRPGRTACALQTGSGGTASARTARPARPAGTSPPSLDAVAWAQASTGERAGRVPHGRRPPTGHAPGRAACRPRCVPARRGCAPGGRPPAPRSSRRAPRSCAGLRRAGRPGTGRCPPARAPGPRRKRTPSASPGPAPTTGCAVPAARARRPRARRPRRPAAGPGAVRTPVPRLRSRS
ncbi:helix-turn-helix domain-containing protein [Streptomyces sp. NPDC001380]|uniref:helix-turn-helix domain-containing protein n=1 Tax=Streptomyces sp. NPDC001380 TaxID=3364566 RepID=UPI00367D948E